MIKILLVVLIGTMACAANAGTVDGYFGKVWSEIAASDNFHFLDNASVEICKDLNKHRYYTGSSTYLYKYGYLSLDFIGIKRLDKSSTVIPGGGVRFFAGDYLYQRVRPIRDVINALMPDGKALMGEATLGISANRDFSNGKTIVIIYGGLVKQF